MGEGEDAQAGSTKGTKSLIHSWVRVLTLTHHMGEGEDAQASSTNGRGRMARLTKESEESVITYMIKRNEISQE